MAATILIEASPWSPSTGTVVPVALAGGGRRAYRHRSRNDWIAGVGELPRFSAAIQFDQNGFSGGAKPETGVIEFTPGDFTKLAVFAALLWNGADIEIFTGDDELAAPVWTRVIKGVVETAQVRSGTLLLKVRDSSGDLDVPLASDRFTGAGGLEGDAVIAERIKRRSFGWCWNVEARLLKQSTLVFEVGDPAFPLQSIINVKDIGRSAAGLTLIGWQGSAAATLAALEASSIVQGGAAIAPSIACFRWWTEPVGPLTVDLCGEVGAGFVDKAADIAARVIATRSTITISNQATAAAWRPDKAGVHIENAGETISQVLDRLLRGVSLMWAAKADGTLEISEIKLTGSVETLLATDISRSRTFKPLRARRLGYRRNHREHDDSEISAVLRDDNGLALTAGATLGLNLTSSGGTVLSDAAVITNLGTSNNTSNVAGSPAATVDAGASAANAGVNPDGSIKTGKVDTGALVANSATIPWLAYSSSVINFAAATDTNLLYLSVTKEEGGSILEVNAQCPLYGVDAVDVYITFYVYQSGSPVASRVFTLKVDGNNTTNLPFSYEEYFDGLAAGSYVVYLNIQRFSSNSCSTVDKYHLRVREFMR